MKTTRTYIATFRWGHLSKSQVLLTSNQEVMSIFVILQYLEIHALVHYSTLINYSRILYRDCAAPHAQGG